ncbi:hypothetical protein BGAL_0851g00010 [Botrytis galanthina]|uniref:Major facilitator superfamily (MFS) profile domain-containing protein n=1 Tax=Botrytis galanthina TaxID=278940 RepID=A0A4S8QHE5_9HELO|nr:hypothetical protein BGAL_0851g00010 [Botrytis galanthina]
MQGLCGIAWVVTILNLAIRDVDPSMNAFITGLVATRAAETGLSLGVLEFIALNFLGPERPAYIGHIVAHLGDGYNLEINN